jgi:mRNA-degrading endonuclease RelE of RelBE toxin-antitoxin system
LIYKVKFTKTGKASLLKIDKEIGKRILSKIEWLSENLDLIRLTPLKGDLSSFYKL